MSAHVTNTMSKSVYHFLCYCHACKHNLKFIRLIMEHLLNDLSINLITYDDIFEIIVLYILTNKNTKNDILNKSVNSHLIVS